MIVYLPTSTGDFYGNIPYMKSMGLYILSIFILSNSIYVIMSIIVRSFFHFYLFYHLYGSISSCSPSNIYIVLFMSTSMSIYFCPAFYCQFPKLTMLKSSPDLLHLILSSESEGSHDVLIEKGSTFATNLWLK